MGAVLTNILRSTANSAGAVKDKANRIVAESKGTSVERTSQLTGDSLKNLQDQINKQNQLINSLAQVIIDINIPVVVDDGVTLNGVPVTY